MSTNKVNDRVNDRAIKNLLTMLESLGLLEDIKHLITREEFTEAQKATVLGEIYKKMEEV